MQSSNRLAFCILVLLVAPTHPINERSQLYRCYIIWGSKKKVLILPALCSLATVVLTVISWLRKPGGQGAYLISFGAPFIMTLGTNLLLMLLTAGRILYKGRETQIVLGPTFRKKYNTAAVSVLESGALYCFCLIPWAASQFIRSNSEWVAVFAGISGALVAQTVNIAPTLILVRVGMGRDRIQETTPFSGRVPSGDTIRFRVPVNLEDRSYPVVELK